jgi:hypothetical protein
MDRLSVVQAAEVLGVTQAAVYKRIQRGTIEHDKDPEGRVVVYLDASDIPSDKSTDTTHGSTDKSMADSDPSTDRSMDGSNGGELIAELRAHNEHLRLEVEAWREESRRKDAILMTMAQRIPELEAAPEPRESSEAPSEERGGSDTPSGKEEFPQRRSWLSLFLFGP